MKEPKFAYSANLLVSKQWEKKPKLLLMLKSSLTKLLVTNKPKKVSVMEVLRNGCIHPCFTRVFRSFKLFWYVLEHPLAERFGVQIKNCRNAPISQWFHYMKRPILWETFLSSFSFSVAFTLAPYFMHLFVNITT